MITFFVLLLLAFSLEQTAPPLTTHIQFGAKAGFVPVTPNGARTEYAKILTKNFYSIEFQTYYFTSTWQPSDFATSISSNGSLNMMFVANGWTQLKTITTANKAAYDTYIDKIATYFQTLTGRAYLVLEPDFNTADSLRTSTEFSSIMIRARTAILAKTASRSALQLFIGQGITLRDPLSVMAAEWLSMTTTSLAHVADFDFVGIGVSIAPPQVVKLQTSHCFIRIMAQWVTDTFKKETFVVNMDVVTPHMDFEWNSYYLRTIDEMLGDATGLYYAGLRGIGLPDAVCPSNAIDGSCMAWGTWMGAQFDEKTLYVKFGPANWEGFSLRETPLNRVGQLKLAQPRFPCHVYIPVKSGLIYGDYLVQWEGGKFGWRDTSRNVVSNYSQSASTRLGDNGIEIKFSANGAFELQYASPFPLSPLKALDVAYLVFQIRSAFDLRSSMISVSLGGSKSVMLSSYVMSTAKINQFQTIEIPRSALANDNDIISKLTITSTTAITVLIDRLSLDMPALPCDLATPSVPCGPLVFTFGPTGPTTTSAPRCGNGVIEGNEKCDGGLCCTAQCVPMAAGTLCRPRDASSQCDTADLCNGVSGACHDSKRCANSMCNACPDAQRRCTMNDVCQANGQCAGEYVCDCGTSAAVCDTDRSQCTVDQCVKGACSRMPLSGGFCDDGDECTIGDTCINGVCVGTTNKCQAATAKTTLGTARPTYTAKSCSIEQWGKELGCPCEPGDYCSVRSNLRCDVAAQICIPGADTTASGTGSLTATSGDVNTQSSSSTDQSTNVNTVPLTSIASSSLTSLVMTLMIPMIFNLI